jgi:signal transduction histidine kinase
MDSIWAPNVYASSLINPSLGDLLLNALFLAVIIVLLLTWVSNHALKTQFRNSVNWSYIVVGMLAVISVSLLWLIHWGYQSIYSHSSLSLDIYRSVDIKDPMIIIYALTILYSVLLFWVQYFLIQLLYLFRYQGSQWISIFILSLALTWAILTGTLALIVIFSLNALFLWLCYKYRLFREFGQFRFANSLFFLLSTALFSLIFALSVYQGETLREHLLMEEFAEELLVEKDELTEFLLSNLKNDIEQDPFITNKFLHPFSSTKSVTEKIQRVYMGGYLSKYSTRISLFNAMGEPLNWPGSPELAQLRKNIQSEYEQTNEAGLFYADDLSPRYVLISELRRYGYVIGHIVIHFEIPTYATSAVYPDLLMRTDKRLIRERFQFVVRQGEKILYSSRQLKQELPLKGLQLKSQNNLILNGYRTLSRSTPEGKGVWVMAGRYGFYRFFTNYSLAFLTYVLLGVLVLFVVLILRQLKRMPVNYSTKIQLALSLAFFLPLVALSFTLYTVVIEQSKRSIIDEYKSKIKGVSSALTEDLSEYRTGEVSRGELILRLAEHSKVLQEDLNLYGSNGQLLISTQPAVFNSHILPDFANPIAYRRMLSGVSDDPVIVGEKAGNFSFRSSYFPLIDPKNQSITGVISMPFFEYRAEKDSKIIEILANILNSFTIIFLVTFFITFLSSTWLTRPLQYLTDRIRGTNFIRRNVPLEWNIRDEIGQLIFAYNAMLNKLEISRAELSKREKEEAWREMAKQVAHEIKNPLTPMKLNLQYLLSRNSKTDEKERHTLESIIKQVDTLSEIANSFSAFAQMPVPKLKPIDLKEVLGKAINLFNSNRFRYEISPHDDFQVMGDENLFGRVFQNILINALQASKAHEPIEVRLSKERSTIRVEIQDYGKGIPKELQENIFQPNFTTKSTGSGIGLAIAKKGVEHAGGQIWFQSAYGQGTTFFLEFSAI